MENDPNKKESKGKRLWKKALRRTSKTSNSSELSSLDQGIGVTRSKSFENKRQSIEINDSAPLPTPDGTKEKAEHSRTAHKLTIDERIPSRELKLLQDSRAIEGKSKKMVDIQESRNEFYEEATTASKSEANGQSISKLEKNKRLSDAESSKKGLKRKLEEESGAGTSGASTGTSDNDADDKDPSKDKKKKNRCAVCRKKVGLTGFECRCGGLFCAVHRYSDKHECSFDYRELGAQEIRRNNPVVVSQKIHKI